jgi:RHS repeat-associated protein
VPLKAFTIRYYQNDQIGTPRELTDENGKIKWAATYKTWGTVETEFIDDDLHSTEHNFFLDGNTVRKVAKTQQRAMARTNDEANNNVTAEANAQSRDDVHQPLRFQGQYFDEETGLHYNRFRYYDPDCGRFVSQDPIGLEGGSNLFLYAPNPTNWIDPFGLSPGKCRPCLSPECEKLLAANPDAKIVVMGENMRRVKEAADAVGGNAYRPWKNDPFNFDLGMQRNERWIRDQMKEGHVLVDIGPDFPRRAARKSAGQPKSDQNSPFYEMERRNVQNKKYGKHCKAFKRGVGVPWLSGGS